MNQIEANRATALYNLMNDFPKDHPFSIYSWQKNIISDHNVLPLAQSEQKALDCGTTCCAAGWGALMIPSWKRHMKFSDTYESLVSRDNEDIDDTFEMLAKFLGVSESETFNMFSPDGYSYSTVTPKQVAKNIKKVINDNGFGLIDA